MVVVEVIELVGFRMHFEDKPGCGRKRNQEGFLGSCLELLGKLWCYLLKGTKLREEPI